MNSGRTDCGNPISSVPVKIGVSGAQQGTAEQKIQCKGRRSNTPSRHRSQRAAPDLYKWPEPTWATVANNSATQGSKSREEDSDV